MPIWSQRRLVVVYFLCLELPIHGNALHLLCTTVIWDHCIFSLCIAVWSQQEFLWRLDRRQILISHHSCCSNKSSRGQPGHEYPYSRSLTHPSSSLDSFSLFWSWGINLSMSFSKCGQRCLFSIVLTDLSGIWRYSSDVDRFSVKKHRSSVISSDFHGPHTLQMIKTLM